MRAQAASGDDHFNASHVDASMRSVAPRNFVLAPRPVSSLLYCTRQHRGISRLNCGKCCRSSVPLIVNYSTWCNATSSVENGNAAIVCFRVLFEFLLVNQSARVDQPRDVTE